MDAPVLTAPAGFSMIPGGTFAPLTGSTLGTAPITVTPFAMAQTPITNAQWAAVTQGLGQDRFILLNHNWQTGVTSLAGRGQTIEQTFGGPVRVGNADIGKINFDHGDVIVFGSQILLKMTDNPSAQYDSEGRVFSRVNQPVVGITYFHAAAWCLFKTLMADDGFVYDLPTDAQFEYVASNGGTQEYGTEGGRLFGPDGRKLAHIDEYRDGKGTTVDVDDPRYVQALPFGVQTTGNVWRWIRMNPAFQWPFGLRGGSWSNDASVSGHAGARNLYVPDVHYFYVGFSPVAVRALSPAEGRKGS
jgi:formylglycine-generating enzyme required for sulfatase activity